MQAKGSSVSPASLLGCIFFKSSGLGFNQTSHFHQKCLEAEASEFLASTSQHSTRWTARWADAEPRGVSAQGLPARLLRQMNREVSEGQSGAYLL